MRKLIGIAFLVAVVFISWNLASTPTAPFNGALVRDGFVKQAQATLTVIERAHQHDLDMGVDRPPNEYIDDLNNDAQTPAEKDVAEKLSALLIIVEANSDEYDLCDARIEQSLASRQWPVNFYPACR